MALNPSAPLAVSCGEPAGIGPEIAQKAWAALKGDLPFVWLGDPRHLPLDMPWQAVSSPAEALDVAQQALPVLAQTFQGTPQTGTADPANAQGVIDAIATGVSLVQSGACSGLCTAPIHKKALLDGAAFAYPGHTEYLAALAGQDHVVMMLACDMLRVVPVTIHIAIDAVPRALTPALLEETLKITEAALRRDFGLPNPRMAVAGLNPHAGEGGAMGREEGEMIAPLIERLKAGGMTLSGPHSADTMFHAGARKSYDVAICMYHDQALIPIKTLDFSGGVNVTLGLPFVRTSPDHGTAFDIAGQDKADATSMIAALHMAARMARNRKTPSA